MPVAESLTTIGSGGQRGGRKQRDPGARKPGTAHRSVTSTTNEYYYGVFWSGVPDLNNNNLAVREEGKKVARFSSSRRCEPARR